MDWKIWVQSWIPLIVVTVGWFLNSGTQRRQRSLDTRLKLHDTKVELYAEWIHATVHNFHEYVASHPTKPTKYIDISVLSRKLSLLEDDLLLRQLVHRATKVWPEEGTELFNALYYEIHGGPDFGYEPFDSVIKEITDRVRSIRPKE